MSQRTNKRSCTLLQIASTVVEEGVLAAVLLGLLPLIGIRTPVWLIAALAVAWAAWSYLTYRLVSDVISKPPILGPEAMVGSRCIVATPLCPEGYVKTGGELWRARSTATDSDAGVEVVVTEVRGLTLLVVPLTEAQWQNGKSEPKTGKSSET